MKFLNRIALPIMVIVLFSKMVYIITAATTRKAICATAAMNYIIVETYGKNVQEAEVKELDSSLQKEFVAAYKDFLGEKETKKVFEHLGEHLMYVLKLAKRTYVTKTELLGVLRAKSLALAYAANFILCDTYVQIEEQFHAESCHVLASYLFIFSHQGMSELVEKIRKVCPDNIFHTKEKKIQQLLTEIEEVQKYKLNNRMVGNTYPSKEPLSWTFVRGTYDKARKYITMEIKSPEEMNNLFRDIIFQKKQLPINNFSAGNKNFIWDHKEEVPQLWRQAIKLNHQFREGGYDIVKLIQEIIMEEAVTEGVYRVAVEEQCNRSRPTEPISIEGEHRKWEHNLKFE